MLLSFHFYENDERSPLQDGMVDLHCIFYIAFECVSGIESVFSNVQQWKQTICILSSRKRSKGRQDCEFAYYKMRTNERILGSLASLKWNVSNSTKWLLSNGISIVHRLCKMSLPKIIIYCISDSAANITDLKLAYDRMLFHTTRLSWRRCNQINLNF